MTKTLPKLTNVQARALEFIRTSLESSGTAPTLRELCIHMGYSAIGSAQDLVRSLRQKGFLLVPDRQSARSLVLSSQARALHAPKPSVLDDTYLIPCFRAIPGAGDRTGTIRLSVSMFERPYPAPEEMYGIRASDDSMGAAGILPGDWLVVHRQASAKPGAIVAASLGSRTTIGRLKEDQQGSYVQSEPLSRGTATFRPSPHQPLEILGRLVALQRIQF